jgi:hypothetical protein
MTLKMKKKLTALREATEKYSPRVQTQLSGTDSAITASAAKYYVALKKLASK